MSYERVKDFFENIGMGDRVVLRESASDTVAHAAEAIGCLPEHIAKTMSFILSDGPILIVAAGDAKVANPKFKAEFGQKAVMIPWDEVEGLVGHAPGGVCPFAVADGVRVFLDVSLRRFETVYTAAGSSQSTVTISPDELERIAVPERWVDVCKDWE